MEVILSLLLALDLVELRALALDLVELRALALDLVELRALALDLVELGKLKFFTPRDDKGRMVEIRQYSGQSAFKALSQFAGST